MFNRNKKLRAAGEEVKYTKELIDEYIKCKEDVIYFAEKYFYIVSIDKGKHKIKMYDFQKKIIKAFQSDNDGRPHLILMLPRQMGKCFSRLTKVKIRHKSTGEIRNMHIFEFFDMIAESCIHD